MSVRGPSNGTRGVGSPTLLSNIRPTDLPIRPPSCAGHTLAHPYIVKVDDGDRSSGPANGSHIVPDSVGVIEDVGGCRGVPVDMWPDKHN